MLLSIIKSYLTLLLSVGAGSFFILLTGLFFIFKKPSAKKSSPANPSLDADFLAIAGDDVITTQLDLARAYIETDKKTLAATILGYVIKQGNAEQQQEAQQLMKHI